MARQALFFFLLLAYGLLQAQSPHGDDELTLECALCHNASGWSVALEDVSFDHSITQFELEGTHALTDCKLCHSSLVFSEAPLDCASCHNDVHSMSVGNDCVRCHNAENWLVDIIPELHEENGFPLMGAHNNLSCVECHSSETNLRFDRIGNECFRCHQEDYLATQNPAHEDAGFSTNCLDCHSPLSFGWETEVVTHDFFPLTLGHDIQDCAQCHTTGNFSEASPDCINCHSNDYTATQNPNHITAGFSNDCAMCHTTNPDWKPAEFDHDALYFPIYSGEHEGEWNECTDCHTNTANYLEVSCTNCHTNPETDNEHSGITGYSYVSSSCLACHPRGESDGFNHNSTNFPLTQSHANVNCIECHANGYQGTPTQCEACHLTDYNSSLNPDHNALGISTDCAACHTAAPDWMPADFGIHNNYYQLNGAHAAIANDCASCHAGDYNNTPNTCFGCHEADYNSATSPDHATPMFPISCEDCHTENDWSPSTFDHDALYFPINSGKHEGEWNSCTQCHSNPNNYADFTCLTCHTNPTTDNDHSEVTGYSYVSTACLQCHPHPL